MGSLLWYSTITLLLTLHTVHGCFDELKALRMPSVWVQGTGIYSFLRYEIGPADNGDKRTIRVLPGGRQTSGRMNMTCLRAYGSYRFLVEMMQADKMKGDDVDVDDDPIPLFRCLQFESLSKRVLVLAKTETKSSRREVNCDTDDYTTDKAVLIDDRMEPGEPCPLTGSYQAMLHDPHNILKRCEATIRFRCSNNLVTVTLGSKCHLPLFKYYSNKIRHQYSVSLVCKGEWGGEENIKTMVLRNTDKVSNIWCLHFEKLNGSNDLLRTYITFDGHCSRDAFSKDFTPSKDTMHGHLVSFVPIHDTRCRDKFHINSCRNKLKMYCSETNSCPSECGRCYVVPKTHVCKFRKETLGQWEMMDANQNMIVNISMDSIQTSSRGEFLCRSESKTTQINYPVVQYDKTIDCLPFYACLRTFTPSPGVLIFNIMPSILARGEPLSCQESTEIYDKHSTSNGEMVTLLNSDRLQETPCEFGSEYLFNTASYPCRLHVADCEGQCNTLNVTYDNETCQEQDQRFPIANSHQCRASMKFQDGIRALITYSDVLKKYSCWIFTGTRLFVIESYMCNRVNVNDMFSDKYAAETYDPIRALLVPPLTQSRASVIQLPLTSLWISFTILVVKTWL